MQTSKPFVNKFSSGTILWTLWFLVTAFGSMVGFTVFFIFFNSGASWTTLIPKCLALIGVLVGVGQWALLRMQLKKVWMWIPLTAIGFPLSVFLDMFASSRMDLPFMGIVVGIVLGVSQWLVLYKKVENSILWIPASILSWGIGITATMQIIDNWLLSGAVLGILVGAISGVSISFLMRRSGS